MSLRSRDDRDADSIGEINLGVTGAKRTSFSADNPKAIAAKICRKHPKWSHSDLTDAVAAAIIKEGGFILETAVKHAAANFVTSALWERQRGQRKTSPPPPKPSASNFAASVDQGISRVKALVLLDLMMPNGKALRACTGIECGTFGGWLVALKRRVGKQIVGDVLDETALRELYAAE